MAIEAASIRVTAEADVSDASRQLQQFGGQVDAAARRMDTIGQSGARAGQQVSASTRGMSTAIDSFAGSLSPVPLGFAGIGVAAAGATAAVGAFAADSVAAFVQFEQQMAQVFTLLPNASEQAMGEMTADVRQFALDFGVSTEQVTQGLYDALSAGVPPGNVFEFLETAQKAATAGMTDLSTTVAGVSSVVNAFGSDVITAAEASDIMFQTVNVGQTTFEELSRNVADVTPLAAALGVSFEDVGAALATMTAQGTRTTVATTQLRAMLVELSTAGTEAAEAFEQVAGVSFQTFIDQGGSVAEAMAIVEQAAARSGIPVQQLFGSIEAGLGALTLSGGNLGTFTENVELMGNAAGSTEDAYATMADTGAQSLRDLSAAWNDLKLTVGEGLAPAVQGLADAINALPVSKTISILLDITVPGASDNDVAAFLADALSGLDDIQRAGEVYTVLTGGQRDYNDAVEEGVALQHEQAGAFQQYIDDYLAGTGYAIVDQQALNSEAEKHHFWQQQMAIAQRELEGARGDGTQQEAAAVAELQGAYGKVLPSQQAFADQLLLMDQEVDLYVGSLTAAEQQAYRLAAANSLVQVSQDMLSNAYQIGLGVQQTYNQQAGEYQSQANAIREALAVWEQQLADGTITQEQYNAKVEAGNRAIERYEGGVADATTTAGDYAIANSQLMEIQDQVNAQYPNLVKGSDEYNAALRAAAASAGISQEVVDGMLGSSGNLAGVIGDALVPAIMELIASLKGLDETEAEPDLSVDTSEFDSNLGVAGDELIQFSSSGPHTTTVDADNSPALDSTGEAETEVTDYASGTYRATLEADNSPAVTDIGTAQVDVDDYASGTYRATLEAETSAAETQVWNLRNAIDGVPPSFTVYAYADTSQAVAQIEGLGALIPHSPAEEGPFSELPNWDWVFEGIGTAAEQYTGEALEHLKTYVDTARAIYDTLGAGLDVGAALAGGGVLPSDEAIATLRDRAQYAVSVMQEVAAQFATEGLDAAKAFSETGRAVFDLFGAALDLLAGDEWAIPTDAEISRLKFAVEHAVRSIMDTALVMDSEGVLAAGLFSSSAEQVMAMLGTAADAFGAFAGLDMPSDADISRLKFAIEHAVESIRWTAAALDAEGVQSAATFSAAAETVMAMLGTAVETLSSEAWDIASDAEISRLKFATEHAVRSIADSAAMFDGPGLEAARGYAAASDEIMAMLATAVEAFSGLAALETGETSIDAQVAALVRLTRRAILAVEQAGASMSSEGLAAAQTYADSAGSVVGMLVSGVDAFDKLTEVEASADVTAAVQAIVRLSEQAVVALVEAAATMDSDGLDAAEQFAEAGNGALDLIAGGVQGLVDLGDAEFAESVDDAIDAFLALVERTVAKVALAAATMDEDALAAAESYADAAKAVVDLLAAGSADFDGLAGFASSVRRNIDGFFDGIALAVDKLLELGVELDTGLDAAAEIAAKVNEIIELLGGAGASGGGGMVRAEDGSWVPASYYGGGGSSPLVPGWPVVRGGSGLQPQLSPPEFEDWLSEMVGINASLEQIGDAIEQQVGDLEQTQLDEQLALLQEVFANPENFPAVMLDHVLAAFKQGLGDAGVDQQDVYDSINQALIDAGIEPLSPEDFAEWGESWEQQYAEKMDELLSGVKGGALSMQAAVDRVTQTLLSSDVLFPDGGLDWRSAPFGASKGSAPIIEEEPEPEPASTFNPSAANGGLALAAAPALTVDDIRRAIRDGVREALTGAM